MERISKLKSLVQIDRIYRDYLYDEDDDRPVNETLKKFGFKPLGELKVKLKDKLDANYEHCQGQVYTIDGFSVFGGDVIFLVEEIDGEFDFEQIEEII
jgi:hypothetical protein